MARAQRRDASRSEKFFFRKDVYLPGRGPPSSACSSSGEGSPSEGELQCGDGDLRNCYGVPHNYTPLGPVEEEYQEMSMDEIMNGKVS
jgi:glutamate--cysteine ligase catalytic subunit